MLLTYKTTPENITRDKVTFLNSFFSLAEREIDVLVFFINYALSFEKLEDKHLWPLVFGPTGRKQAASSLGFKDRNSIDQYVARLKEKKVLTEKNNVLTIQKIFLSKDKELTIKFEL
jgi:hypothetical protein